MNGGGLRERLADVSLLALVVLLPLATIWISSRELFSVATVLNLLFVLAMLPEVRDRVTGWSMAPVGRIAVLLVLGLLAVWQQVQGPMWDVPRLWWYFSLPLLMAGLLGWFEIRGALGLRLLVCAKLPLIALAIVWACGLSLQARWGLVETPLFGPIPIYRHVRNLNDELPWALAFAALLLASGGRLGRGLAPVGLLLFGYFTAWSGSRGQMLGLAVFVAVLLAARALPLSDRRLWLAVAAAAAGVLLALACGEGERLLAMLGRSTGEAGIGIGSGRDRIWAAALDAVTASPWTLATGLGPDAFARLALDRDFRQLTGPIIQPHNSLVLWLLEFGVVGLLAAFAALLLALRLAWRRLQARRELEMVNLAAALLIGQATFSMVTGIAYHVMPATFMLVLIAFLATRDLEPGGGGSIVAA